MNFVFLGYSRKQGLQLENHMLALNRLEASCLYSVAEEHRPNKPF